MIDFYTNAFRNYGRTMWGVGWLNVPDWKPTYEIASEAFDGSCWDVGCGWGMGKRFFTDWYGCDVVREMVEGPRMWVGDHRSARGLDFAVLNGVFNVGYTWKFVKDVVETVLDSVNKGVVIGYVRGPAKPPFSAFSTTQWQSLERHGRCRRHGPHGCSHTLVIEKEVPEDSR